MNMQVQAGSKAERLAWIVVNLLEQVGVPAIVAGGAARDVYHGVEPKDYDIVVLRNHDSLKFLELTEAMLHHKHIPYEKYADSASASSSPHIDWVIKIDDCVDLIAQKEVPETPLDAIEAFDCTINMAWFSSRGVVELHPDYPKPGELVKMLPKCDNPVNRSCYLGEKYPQYQWPFKCPATPPPFATVTV